MNGTRVPLKYPWALGVNKKNMFNKRTLPIFRDHMGRACSRNQLKETHGILWYLPETPCAAIPSYPQMGDPTWKTVQGSQEFTGNWIQWVDDITSIDGHIHEFPNLTRVAHDNCISDFIYPNTLITRDATHVSLVTVTPIDMYTSRLTWSMSSNNLLLQEVVSERIDKLTEDNEDNTFVCL